MTGLSIFLLGSIALSNVGLICYLLLDRDRKPKVSEDKGTAPVNESDIPVEQEHTKSLAGKSKTRMEDFDELFDKIEKKAERLYQVLDRLEGDARLKDVEFVNPEDAPTKEEIENDANEVESAPVKKFSRMTKDEEKESFNDVRIEDVEPDMVSAPSANGNSIEDIEKSMEVASNPDATPEEKAQAGRVLVELADTNLMDIFSDDPAIMEGVMKCCRESTRMEFTSKTSKRPVKITHRKTTIEIAEKLEDFNPADLLK